MAPITTGAAWSPLAAGLAAFARPFTRSRLARLLIAAGGAVVACLVERAAAFGAGNGLADQLFDRRHRLEVERSDHGDRGSRASGTAGAADAVDIIIGMMGH